MTGGDQGPAREREGSFSVFEEPLTVMGALEVRHVGDALRFLRLTKRLTIITRMIWSDICTNVRVLSQQESVMLYGSDLWELHMAMHGSKSSSSVGNVEPQNMRHLVINQLGLHWWRQVLCKNRILWPNTWMVVALR